MISSQNNVRKYRTKGHEQVYSKEDSIQKSPFIVMSVHKNESEFECGLIRKQYFQIYVHFMH